MSRYPSDPSLPQPHPPPNPYLPFMEPLPQAEPADKAEGEVAVGAAVAAVLVAGYLNESCKMVLLN